MIDHIVIVTSKNYHRKARRGGEYHILLIHSLYPTSLRNYDRRVGWKLCHSITLFGLPGIDVHLVCFVLFYCKGSIDSHQFSQEWNGILFAYASRINTYLARNNRIQFSHSWKEFLSSKNFILALENIPEVSKLNSWLQCLFLGTQNQDLFYKLRNYRMAWAWL